MKLSGSCHCHAVRFTVDAPSPVPFLRRYGSICRKTAGAGGYAINLGADRSTLWLYGPTWPELVHPYASAIDTPLPPERVHVFLGFRANWAEPELRPGDRSFDEYPDELLAEWHERQGRGES